MTTRKTKRTPLVVGWREWVLMTGLGCNVAVKAKIDTGAATSALHAPLLQIFEREGEPWATFTFRPYQRVSRDSMRVEAPIVDERRIRVARRQELAESGQLTEGQAAEMEMQLSVLEAFGRPLQERMARENAQRKEALDRFGLSGMEEGAGGEGPGGRARRRCRRCWWRLRRRRRLRRERWT